MSQSIEEFQKLIYSEDVEGLKTFLQSEGNRGNFVNEPLFHFGQRAVHMAKTNLPLLDVLLHYGADINLKSDWLPGGFHILEETSPELGAQLVARGAKPDILAHTGWDDCARVKALLRTQPTLVHAAGGDGVRPLHYAQSVEMARLLLDHGAKIDARCRDHESTAAQYMAGRRPDVLNFLVESGAEIDIFLAIVLDDRSRVERILHTEACAHWRIGEGRYDVPTKDPDGIKGGNIYLWRLGGALSPLEVAAHLGKDEMRELIYPHASPRDQFATSCRKGNTEAALALIATNPTLLGTATPPLKNLLGDMVWQGNADAVRSLLACGADLNGRWHCNHTPLIVASLQGYASIVQRLLEHGAELDARNDFGGTALHASVFGSVTTEHFTTNAEGDYPECARLLIGAGASPEVDFELGAPDVLEVLRAARAS